MNLKILTCIINLINFIKKSKDIGLGIVKLINKISLGILKNAFIYHIFWFIGGKLIYHYLLATVWNNDLEEKLPITVIQKPKERKFLVIFNLTYVWVRWYMLRNLPKLIKKIKKNLYKKYTYILLKPVYKGNLFHILRKINENKDNY